MQITMQLRTLRNSVGIKTYEILKIGLYTFLFSSASNAWPLPSVTDFQPASHWLAGSKFGTKLFHKYFSDYFFGLLNFFPLFGLFKNQSDFVVFFVMKAQNLPNGTEFQPTSYSRTSLKFGTEHLQKNFSDFFF